MLEEWVESEAFPKSKAKVRPLDGRRKLAIALKGLMNADLHYETFAWAVVDWEHAPLDHPPGEFSEKYDRTVLENLHPTFVAEVVFKCVNQMSELSEDEAKNSESQPT